MATYASIRQLPAQPAFARSAAVLGSRARSITTAQLVRGARLAGQAALLCLIYLASSALVDLVPIPVPSNLLALLLLLGLLTTGLLRLAYVEELATFLLRHLTFFFVPFMVGLLAQGGLLASSGVALLVCLIVAIGVGIVVAGLAAQAALCWTGAQHADTR
jgi:holin-like protein